MHAPVYCRPVAYRMLRRELEDLTTGESLFRAAFAIALHERPEASLEEAEMLVKQLATTVRRRVNSNSREALLAHLHDVVFDLYGLQGNLDDYYNPSNSYLPDVLHSRRGLPITLVLIYKRIAEHLDLVVHGINSPGHFLAEVEGPEAGQPSMYIDPFFGGILLTVQEAQGRIAQAIGREVSPTPEWLARATPQQWLARMILNLQAVFSSTGQQRHELAMQELLVLLEK